MNIFELSSDADVAEAFAVMRELRPHLDEHSYQELVDEQRRAGYRLAAVRLDDGVIAAVAGFWIGHKLAWGRHLYLDDLVTAAAHRSKGYGKALLEWLEAEARKHGCAQFELDSGTARHGAHRFYLGNGYDISAFHFRKTL